MSTDEKHEDLSSGMTADLGGGSARAEDSCSARQVPFFAQAAVLARLAQSADAGGEIGSRVVIQVLKNGGRLARFFFSTELSPVWGQVLEENEFFSTPPEGYEENRRKFCTFWHAQQYLLSLSAERPDLVLRHLRTLAKKVCQLAGDRLQALPPESSDKLSYYLHYLSNVVKMLSQLPSTLVAEALPEIVFLLEDKRILFGLADAAFQFTTDLAHKKNANALIAFRELCKPLAPQGAEALPGSENSAVVREVVGCPLPNVWYDEPPFLETLIPFHSLGLQPIAEVLEQHLSTSLEMEGRTRNLESGSWRTAIGPDFGGIVPDYKNLLLSGLRNCLEGWARDDPGSIEPLLEAYLEREGALWSRLALHILSLSPECWPSIVERQLLNPNQWYSSEIQREFLTLFRESFQCLPPFSQEKVLQLILDGPGPDFRANLEIYLEKYVAPQNREGEGRKCLSVWVRDRLQIVKGFLPPSAEEPRAGKPEPTGTTDETACAEPVGIQLALASQRWRELRKEFGLSRCPEGEDFRYEDEDGDPIGLEQLSDLPPTELLEFLASQKPNGETEDGHRSVSVESLADALGRAVQSDPGRYSPVLIPIAKLRTRFANAILNVGLKHRGSSESESESDESNLSRIGVSELWEIRLRLAEALLKYSPDETDIYWDLDGGWAYVRLNVVSMIREGLENALRDIDSKSDGTIQNVDAPSHQELPKIRALLLVAVEDPDSGEWADRPPQGHDEHRDPLQAGLNHVRPQVAVSLIRYSQLAYLTRKDLRPGDRRGAGPHRVESEILDVFSRLIDPGVEPSRAVHAIFGLHLGVLYWLDRDWVESNLGKIFPNGADETSQWMLLAAWEAFLFHRTPIGRLFELLRPTYVLGMSYWRSGLKNGGYLEVERALACHLIFDYFENHRPLLTDGQPGCLLAQLLVDAEEDKHEQISIALCQYCEGNLERIPDIWFQVRTYWEWRLGCYTSSEPSEQIRISQPVQITGTQRSSREAETLTRLLKLTPKNESIATMWNLLEATLPLTIKRGSWSWDNLEEFLVREVPHDPGRVINYYRLMHERIPPYFPTQESTARGAIIFEKALENASARESALTLLDEYHSEQGNPFRDIFRRFAR